jgi:leucyl aminopeptidase
MKIQTAVGPIKTAPGALAIFLFDDEARAPKLPLLNKATANETGKLISASKFSAKKLEVVTHYAERSISPLLILVGLGSRKDFSWRTLRLAAGSAIRAARDAGVKTVALISEDRLANDLSPEEVTRAIVDGLVLGNYRFEYYFKTDAKDKKEITSVTLYFVNADRKKKADQILPRVQVMAECTNMARDYSTHPTNVVNTEYLAAEAMKLSKRGLKVSVLEKKDLAKLGMNLMLAVSKGSAMPPKLIIMDWNPRGAKKTYAFVGKGLVFDSGGLNIKTMTMEEMKSDMSGASAVLAAMFGVAELKPNARVIGVIGAVENAIGPDAYRPSDIYTGYNGKTVEVGNTDAEGRLVLADALAYTIDKYKPSLIIDLATLTGAAVVALGHAADAVFSNDEKSLRAVMDAAERSGERQWNLPLFDDYSEEMKGEISDLRNVPGHRWGGASTAAAFLKEFVGDTLWVHIDIAPTAFGVPASAIQPKATATGSGVRVLLELVTGK